MRVLIIFTRIKTNGINYLAGGNVQLYGVVHLDQRVWVTNGSSIVGNKERNSFRPGLYSLDFAKFVLHSEKKVG